MIRMNMEKFINSLSTIEDRGNLEEKPVLSYLHNLIVLSSISNNAPEISEVDFDTFTMIDLEKYYMAAVEIMESTFPQMEQMLQDFSQMKALRATKTNFF